MTTGASRATLRIAGNVVLAIVFFFAFLLSSRRFMIGWEAGAQGEMVVWFLASLGMASLVFRALRRTVIQLRERRDLREGPPPQR